VLVIKKYILPLLINLPNRKRQKYIKVPMLETIIIEGLRSKRILKVVLTARIAVSERVEINNIFSSKR
jgi:hypothetical protein